MHFLPFLTHWDPNIKILVFKIYPSFFLFCNECPSKAEGTSLGSLSVYIGNTKFYRHLLARYDFGCQSFKISSFLMKHSEIGCLNSQVYLVLRSLFKLLYLTE